MSAENVIDCGIIIICPERRAIDEDRGELEPAPADPLTVL
jgi:hypothetical protein